MLLEAAVLALMWFLGAVVVELLTWGLMWLTCVVCFFWTDQMIASVLLTASFCYPRAVHHKVPSLFTRRQTKGRPWHANDSGHMQIASWHLAILLMKQAEGSVLCDSRTWKHKLHQLLWHFLLGSVLLDVIDLLHCLWCPEVRHWLVQMTRTAWMSVEFFLAWSIDLDSMQKITHCEKYVCVKCVKK